MIRGTAPAVPTTIWTDEELLKACLEGDENAWSALIDKYKNLIYSIPIKYGVPPDDAGEIFQQVCLSLLSELPKIRDHKSLGGWLIKVTLHKCYEWGRRRRHQQTLHSEDDAAPLAPGPDDLLLEVERERILHESLDQLSLRCRQLVQMLFYDTPALPYEEVARKLNLARGSIGFIRMRCLKHLRLLLQEKGF